MWRSAATAHHRVQSLKFKLQRGSGVFIFKKLSGVKKKIVAYNIS